MKEFYLTWVLFLIVSTVYIFVEHFFPNRKLTQGQELRRELPFSLVVVGYDLILFFVFSWLATVIFNPTVMSFIEGTGILTLPNWLRFILFWLAWDFTFFCGHVAMHTKWGWPAHRFHHQAEKMFFLVGLRATIPHLAVPRIGLFWIFVFQPSTELMFFWAIWSSFHNLGEHLNVTPKWLRYVEWLFVTSRTHQIHHFKEEEFRQCNFGAMFTIWDRIFGYHISPESVERIDERPFGIEEDIKPVRMVIGY